MSLSAMWCPVRSMTQMNPKAPVDTTDFMKPSVGEWGLGVFVYTCWVASYRIKSAIFRDKLVSCVPFAGARPATVSRANLGNRRDHTYNCSHKLKRITERTPLELGNVFLWIMR